MSRDGSLPDYERLFGELDLRPADGSRSVHSPAAYLVELLRLVDDELGDHGYGSLRDRRPDIHELALGPANTLTELPYLDVVNEILERRVGPDPYGRMRRLRFPFETPFSLGHQRLRRHLRQLGVDPAAFHRWFAARPDQDVVARERLGLSPEEADAITVPHADERGVRESYGLTADEPLSVLTGLDRFRRATGLGAAEVRELLWQRYGDAPERAGFLFVHQGGPPVGLDPAGTGLARAGGVPPDWFDRVSRFVRLARRTGLSPTDLDLVLRTCCGNRLDAAALRTLAVVLDLRTRLDVPVDVVCSLAAPMDATGAAPGPNPPDLFGRTFPAGMPACVGDVLAPANDEFRHRAAAALGMAEPDLVTVVTRLRAQHARTPGDPGPFDRAEVGAGALSLLHRVSVLTRALGLGVGELFDLLAVLERSPIEPGRTLFDVAPGPAPVLGAHRMLDAPDPASGLWLARSLTAVATWLRDGGLTVDDLVALGAAADPAEHTALVTALRARRDEVALSAQPFVSARFGTRAARVLRDVLVHHPGVASPRDPGLLRLDPAAVPAAAHDAVTDLAVVTAEDFLGLGLDEGPAAKLHTNLVLRGYLTAEGVIVGDAPGVDPPRVAGDFDALREPLFDLVRELWQEEADDDPDTGVPAFLYPTDLDGLPGLTPAGRDELYDNLLHLGHLDDDGQIRTPEFFADPSNVELFTVNADLADTAAGAGELLRARLAAFRATPPELGPDVFTALRLDDGTLDDLLASLHFNGYRDDAGRMRDVAATAALTPDRFALAPDLEPYRRAVLTAIQDRIAEDRAARCTVTADDLRPLADATLAARTVRALEGPVLDGGMIRPALWPSLTEPAPEPGEGPGPVDHLPPEERAIVLGRLAAVLADQRPYYLDPADLAALGLSGPEVAALVEELVDAGDLDAWLTVPPERIAYFTTRGNAAGFAVPGFTDYAREVFGLLHDVAGELTAATGEVADALAAHQTRQRTALLTVVQTTTGGSRDTVTALCRAVCGDVPDALETLLGTDGAAGSRVYRRIRAFAQLATRLDLDATDVAVVFADQDLAGRFPEPLDLPPGVDRFDALLQSADGTVLVFAGTDVHRYPPGVRALPAAAPVTLAELSPALTPLTGVDAAFTRPDGTEWIVGRDGAQAVRTLVRRPGSTRWVPVAQDWGAVLNRFDTAERIDAAFVDEEYRTYLFTGDQYVRYSGTDLTVADEGYPRTIADWWSGERGTAPLPGPFQGALDAAFRDGDGRVHLFSGDRCLTVGEDTDRPIAEVWGRIPVLDRIDAAWTDGTTTYLAGGDVVVAHSDGLESTGLRADDGWPRRLSSVLPGVPAGFESGVDAVLREPDGTVHLFRDGRTVTLGEDQQVVPTAERWGRQEPALTGGRVDSALAGLDGHTYLFSGDRYLRYSGTDHALADVGYPRAVAGDWGGLRAVGVSFVLDGRTHLFGPGGDLFDLPADQPPALQDGRLSAQVRARFAEHGSTFAADARVTADEAGRWRLTDERGTAYTVRARPDRLTVSAADGTPFAVRYSTRDYTVPDAGYPRPLAADRWNLPDSMVPAEVDAVFTGRDGQTYLFSGSRFVAFDARRRWWSEPREIRRYWDSLPFDRVDAAFLGRDGRTYLFRGDRYVRYSGADLSRVDERYPADVAGYWGRVPNRIARTGRVDAALVLDATEVVDGAEVTSTFTYLFSGDQYVRYRGAGSRTVEDGYPAPLSALAREPRFGALGATLTGVDAAVADRDTVHLFSGGTWHSVSGAVARDVPGEDDLRCAFVEDGSLLARTADGWWHAGAVGAVRPSAARARPRTLRGVPAAVAGEVDAVLRGPDGHTYLFAGDRCHDLRLGRDHRIADAWGVPRDTITRDGVVDAAFTGRDGVTYLFRGDQYVTYGASRAGYGAREEQSGPWPVAAHWGGLTSVALAYVEDGRTYVFERPGADGRMRYLTYSGTGYDAPDPGGPRTADAGYWGAPPGFGPPAAVLVQGDTVLLLSGERFVQRTGPGGGWSLPQPIGLLWRHDPVTNPTGVTDGSVLRTAFTGRDGATHFFFTPGGVGDRFGEIVGDVAGDRYARYADGAFSAAVDVRAAWGYPAFTHVDAAYVTPDGVTYLFSGDRYARYSTPDHRDADPGYPRPIAGHLRTEEPFRNLPESFEDGAAVRGVDAVVGDDRSVYVFAGGRCQVASRAAYAARPATGLGRVRNVLAERGRVDAALRTADRTYLFSGDQYVRYTDHAGGPFADEGYPRAIEGSLAAELGIPELPPAFLDGVDAAFRDAGGGIHLFRGTGYLRADRPSRDTVPITARWGRVRSTFAPGGPLDAAFVAPSGELYAFRGDQYVRYGGADLTHADPGHPRTIRDDWGDLPSSFEDGVDGAFVLDGATYLLRGGDYVRWSGGRYTTIDRTFPQPLAARFGDVADYRIDDVHVISRYARLVRRSGGELSALLGGAVPVEDPYQRVADLFGWDAEQLRWVQRHRGFLPAAPQGDERLEIELLLRTADLFAATDRLGMAPSRLHDAVWVPAYGAPPDPGGATDALLVLLAGTLAPEELAAFTARLHEELAEVRRDALVATVLAPDPAPAPGALFEQLLIDVDMGGRGSTTRIWEAISAVQLYLHRYLLDLEPGGTRADGLDPADPAVRGRVRRWWTWLRTYRTWEANRKLFLYPENYLRPELRDTRTPAFRQLEGDLLQAGVTTGTVQAAYRRYLDEYTEVSRLAIAGGYVHVPADADPPGTQELILFGRTRTSPRRFYHRTGRFPAGRPQSASWDAWAKVDVQIDAERVHPAVAFGRAFVFWATVEDAPPERTAGTVVVTAQPAEDGQEVTTRPTRQVVRVRFSFRNLGGEWVPAQVLDSGPPGEDLQDVALSVRLGTLPGHDGHPALLVTCTARSGPDAGAPRSGATFALTPELYSVRFDAPASEPPRAVDLAAIFDEPAGSTPDPDGVVAFGTPAEFAEGPWFSVDHKGGSFLCRPVLPAATAVPAATSIRRNTESIPAWDRVDAAVELPDRTRVFFDSAGERYVQIRADKSRGGVPQPIAARWGRTGRVVTTAQTADTMLLRGGVLYAFCGSQYLRYDAATVTAAGPGGTVGPHEPGYPKDLAGNTERFPRWSRVDYAFTGEKGVEYFFSATLRGWVTSADLTTVRPFEKIVDSSVFPVADRDWLLARIRGGLFGQPGAAYLEAFVKQGVTLPKAVTPTAPYVADLTARGWTRVDAGLVDRERRYLYLAGGTEYVRYTLAADGTPPPFADAGYPQPMPRPVTALVTLGTRRYVFAGDRYALLPATGDPVPAGPWLPVDGRWCGLPAGVTGGLDADEAVYLFLGTDYVRFPRPTTIPYEYAALPHEIVRLTTSTAYKLNQNLLAGGVDGLLDTATQETDELPAFRTDRSDTTTVRLRADRVSAAWLPGSSHLDFQSANGIYYWEIFFHAPLLIAGALNEAQRFAEARTWFESVFDPTRPDGYWRFLPFLAADPSVLAGRLREQVAALATGGADVTALQRALDPALSTMESVAPAFRGGPALTAAGRAGLQAVAALQVALPAGADPDRVAALAESLAVARELLRQYDLFGDRDALLDAYRNDPLDAHAVAALRPVAYRRAVVMGYVDNLIDWGDRLFLQYTRESIDEARMLYVVAQDLLGRRPESPGPRPLPVEGSFLAIDGDTTPAQELAELTADGALLTGPGGVHAGVAHPYFHVPANPVLTGYWDLVDDRLGKIRRSMDITGRLRPVSLFEPPIDPAALARSIAAGGGVESALAGTAAPVPHHRFPVLLRRAQELTDRVRQFGQDLLAALDQRDGEALARLQNGQEGETLALTRAGRQAQVAMAEAGVAAATAARDAAVARAEHYRTLADGGPSAVQIAQLTAMSAAVYANVGAGILRAGSAIAHVLPQALIGPFIVGVEQGGKQVGDALGDIAQVAESAGQVFSGLGEVLGVVAEQERTAQEWAFQVVEARNDLLRLEPELVSAEQALVSARGELAVLDRQIAHQADVATFLRDKFTGVELHQWRAGRLGGLYRQTYELAVQTAREAERAYRFECGAAEDGSTGIGAANWDDRRAGLLAGDALGLDLDRLARAYADADTRGLEITKRISLRELDPLALLRLRGEGACEIALTEDLFDRDFPGHYRRQVRTVAVTFQDGSGDPLQVAAVLTRTGHRTVLAPDPAAVRHLLNPQGAPPATVRVDWRADQEIALSDAPDGAENNGLFELRYDDDRYLPFEGTGAIGTWRLEITGRRPADGLPDDVVLTLRYTAESGGAVFAAAVRGMLRPRAAARYVDVAAEFPDEWSEFVDGDDRVLRLPLTPDGFPGMAGRQVTGLLAVYLRDTDGGDGGGDAPAVRLLLDGDRNRPLAGGRLLRTDGLALPANGSGLRFTVDPGAGPAALRTVALVVTYRANT